MQIYTGIKTAHAFVQKHKTPNRILQALHDSKFRDNVPDDFDGAFEKGRQNYLHQRVFDLHEEKLVCLQSLEMSEEQEQQSHFLGKLIGTACAVTVAICGMKQQFLFLIFVVEIVLLLLLLLLLL